MAKAPLEKIPTPEYLQDLNAKEHYIRELEQKRTERSPHVVDWRDITDSIMPTRGRYMVKDREKSKRANRSVINSKANMAQRTCTAGLKAGIASPARPWFKLGLDDVSLMKFAPVKVWLEQVEQVLYSLFAGSNFYNSLTTEFGDLANFGNGAMIIDEDVEDGIRATTFSPGEYFFGLSNRNAVNQLYREYSVTTLQLIQQFGIKSISQQVRNAYDTGNYNNKFTLVHALEPNMWMDKSQRGWRRMPFSSVYFEMGGDDKTFLERKGYEEWPASTPRWDVDSGDVYGSGPGLVALGDARAIQLLERRKAQAVDKIVSPEMQAPIHLKTGGVNRLPGSTTFVDSNGSNRPIQPIYEMPSSGIREVREEIKEHEQRIDEAYFVNLFLMISNSDRRERITAREIDERHEEKLFALGPMLERNQDENLNVALGRAYRIAMRQGRIPEPPKELNNKALRPNYISILAYAQKASVINSIERGLGFIGQLAASKPFLLDKINAERTTEVYMDSIGFPAGAMSTDEEYNTAKAAYTQQAEQQAQVSQTKDLVGSAELLSKTDTARPSALTDLLAVAGA